MVKPYGERESQCLQFSQPDHQVSAKQQLSPLNNSHFQPCSPCLQFSTGNEVSFSPVPHVCIFQQATELFPALFPMSAFFNRLRSFFQPRSPCLHFSTGNGFDRSMLEGSSGALLRRSFQIGHRHLLRRMGLPAQVLPVLRSGGWPCL